MTRFSMELHSTGEKGKTLTVCFKLDYIMEMKEPMRTEWLYLTFQELVWRWEAAHRPAEFDEP
jgi:hypothetical protein